MTFNTHVFLGSVLPTETAWKDQYPNRMSTLCTKTLTSKYNLKGTSALQENS